ncbi:cytochrome b-c1 complex subunit mitochondrial [Brachionus plicatilis]|uniref:Cytochrome b-c1 complex subunit mitochondrial n=1 Tax=Brachionus plicatilis TaxID=10195 RepID=A0A3M7T276_BRAPC|nr:cytochrome b-c1 complex subunit mitochondrial [Brachionus plicatilis]
MTSLVLRARSDLLCSMPKRFAATASASQAKEARRNLKESVRVTKLDNGVVIASLENYSPISRVAAVLNTGSRDESHTEQGSTHALRVFSNLATRNFSSFGITRNLDQIGAQLSISSTRESTTYLLESTRNNTSRGVDILSEIISRPQLRHWEIDDARSRLEFELDVYDQQPELKIVEMIHKASFKNALSNSLYAPRFNVANLKSELLSDFREKNFTSNRLTLVGLGMQHDDLIRYADQFRLPSGSPSRQTAQYHSSELREENLDDLVHVAVSAEGVSQSSKEVLASALASHAFGSVYSRIKYSNGATRLSRSVLPLAREAAGVTSFNANYSDAGLFGFHLVGNTNDIGKLVKGLYQELNQVAKNGFSNEEIIRAKISLKSSLANSLESSQGFLDALIKGSDHIDADQVLQSVDAVQANDVNAFVKRIASSKHSLAAVGDLSQLPRLDELRA